MHRGECAKKDSVLWLLLTALMVISAIPLLSCTVFIVDTCGSNTTSERPLVVLYVSQWVMWSLHRFWTG